MNQYRIRTKLTPNREVIMESETFGQQGNMILFYNRGKGSTPDHIMYAINQEQVLDISIMKKESVN